MEVDNGLALYASYGNDFNFNFLIFCCVLLCSGWYILLTMAFVFTAWSLFISIFLKVYLSIDSIFFSQMQGCQEVITPYLLHCCIGLFCIPQLWLFPLLPFSLARCFSLFSLIQGLKDQIVFPDEAVFEKVCTTLSLSLF